MLNSQLGKLRLKTLQLLSLADKLGSLRAVADAVHTSQPAVTQAIQEIEQVFGQPLLLRHATGVCLSEAGRVVVRRFRVILQEMDAALDSMHEPVRPVLRLGVLPFMMMNDLIPAVLRHWPMHSLPFRLQLHEGTVPGLRQRLLEGVDDAVVTRLAVGALEPEDAASMRVLQIQQDHLVVFARAEHAVFNSHGSKKLQMQQLIDSNWILPRTGTQMRDSINNLFDSAGHAPPLPLVEAGSLFGLVSLVGATDSLGVAPRSAALKFAEMYKLKCLTVDAFKTQTIPVVAIHHRRQDENTALQLFLTQLQKAAATAMVR